MTRPSDILTAREFVWVHRIRQRIAFERIILTIGNPKDKARAKQFLEAMEQANPELFEDIDRDTPELVEEAHPDIPELFDASEYCEAKVRKTALKMPKEILSEERIVRRAAKEYTDLFHPCANFFNNAMKGLQFLNEINPELFARARDRAIEQREQILTDDIYCKCGCTTPENRQPADSFKITNRGRFENVSRRISEAQAAIKASDDKQRQFWQFFLDKISEMAPEMLQE